MQRKLDFDVFCAKVLSILEVDWNDPCRRDVRIFEDMGLDSLETFELLVVIESLAELFVPLPEVPLIFTLGDAFDYYEVACTAAESDELR